MKPLPFGYAGTRLPISTAPSSCLTGIRRAIMRYEDVDDTAALLKKLKRYLLDNLLGDMAGSASCASGNQRVRKWFRWFPRQSGKYLLSRAGDTVSIWCCERKLERCDGGLSPACADRCAERTRGKRQNGWRLLCRKQRAPPLSGWTTESLGLSGVRTQSAKLIKLVARHKDSPPSWRIGAYPRLPATHASRAHSPPGVTVCGLIPPR